MAFQGFSGRLGGLDPSMQQALMRGVGGMQMQPRGQLVDVGGGVKMFLKTPRSQRIANSLQGFLGGATGSLAGEMEKGITSKRKLEDLVAEKIDPRLKKIEEDLAKRKQKDRLALLNAKAKVEGGGQVLSPEVLKSITQSLERLLSEK